MNKGSLLETILIIMVAVTISIAMIGYQGKKPVPPLAASEEEKIWDNASSNEKLKELKLLTEVLYPELKRYKESLEDNVAQLKSELSGKEEELAALDKELIELENEYYGLLEQDKKLSDRLKALSGKEIDQ